MSYCPDKFGSTPVRPTAAVAACLLLAVVVGCGSPMTPEQKQAVSKIQSLGGKFNLVGGGHSVDLSGTVVENDDLVHLKQVPNLTEVDLRGTQITDEGLVHLRGIETLISVHLERTGVSREGIDELQKAMPELVIRR